ncbi:hypothetical protein BH24ACI4_BH24ACI4_11550 [soil metagenome]
MRPGRPKVALILTEDERVRLDSLAHRSRTAPHLARRARIILACAEGHDNTRVAKRLRVSQTTVCKWRGRSVRERLGGLYDAPRPGAPRRVTDEQVEDVVVRTLEAAPRGATHWSSRGMAKASMAVLGLSVREAAQGSVSHPPPSVTFSFCISALSCASMALRSFTIGRFGGIATASSAYNEATFAASFS